MMNTLLKLLLVLIWCLPCKAQPGVEIQVDSLLQLSSEKTGKLYEKVTDTQQEISKKLQNQQQRLLKKLKQKEEKIAGRLSRFDSVKALNFYENVSERYTAMERKISDSIKNVGSSAGKYIPRMDSLTMMLKFLNPLSENKEKLDHALQSVGEVKTELAKGEELKTFVGERENALKSLLSEYTHLPAGIARQIGKYSQEVYYYKEQLAAWKETLNDPEKIETASLKLLSRLPAFKQFMQQNSELAQLFGQPSGTATSQSLAGLQTRSSIQQLMQQQFGQAGINPQQLIQQKLTTAQAELSKLKENIAGLKSGEKGSGEMPDFKPNSQKTKPFFKRLEYGWNLQAAVANMMTGGSWGINDLGATIGYKFNDRFVAGIGLAYKFGLGSGWKHISFSHEGIGLRSYLDYKMSAPQKGIRVLFSNLWLSGGFEQNYFAAFKNIPELKTVAWQASGLVGISKKIKYKKHEMKTQVLWNFLSYKTQAPPVLFRIGYNL
jgi:hypothetical protein